MIGTFRIGAVILAGGRGSRMHSDIQKQYMLLNGRPLISYALEAFEQSIVDVMVLVTGAGEEDYVRQEILAPLHLKKLCGIVTGGKERYHSVYEGLKAAGDCHLVFIHDGARPFVDQGILERTKEAAETYQACVAGMPVKDTIKLSDGHGTAVETPRRDLVWMVQTPQVFDCALIREAYRKLMESDGTLAVTDDAMVLESIEGKKVRLVEGSYRNIKITTPEDLLVAEAFLQ